MKGGESAMQSTATLRNALSFRDILLFENHLFKPSVQPDHKTDREF
jgi:hypothetical protein